MSNGLDISALGEAVGEEGIRGQFMHHQHVADREQVDEECTYHGRMITRG